MAAKTTGAAAQPLFEAYTRLLAAKLPAGADVCVALSGGMDSCALLHAAAAHRGRWPVSACHVNHGISARADAWESFCRRLCDRLETPLVAHRARPPATAATEQWAREQRLRTFAELPADAVLLAHHADDQAETVLLRLLRGSGARGLAAMAPQSAPAAATLLRPWLHLPRQLISDYAREARLRWVEDDDNFNLCRRRNFLRRRVLPLIAREEKNCAAALAAAGRRCQEAAQLLEQLAWLDDAAAKQPDGGLRLEYFQGADEARVRNWLYHALRARGRHAAEQHLSEAARQLTGSQSPRRLCFDFGGVSLRGWRRAVYWHAPPPPPPPDFTRAIAARAGALPLPALGGALILRAAAGGLSPAKTGETLTLRLRQGGERLKPPKRPTRAVADLLQEASVFPWQRRRLPLLFAGERLAAVAGVAVAEEFSARENETGLWPEWNSAAAT